MMIAILAGGGSSRMGSDKALLTLEGEPLLARTARVALATGLPVAVIGRETPPGWDTPEVRFLADAAPGLGPLGGLQTALQEADETLALACDMPRLTTDTIRWLLNEAARYPAAPGVAVRNGERIEPLFSVYRAACRPHLEAQMASGRRSLQALIAASGFRVVDAPTESAAALTNVNTPEEWQALAATEKKR